MSAETTTKSPHLSGIWLLAYLKEQWVNINTIDYPGVNLWPETQVKIEVANILIDDSDGLLARQFAARCWEYETGQLHKNIPVLTSKFQKFVREVLLSSVSWAHSETRERVGAKKNLQTETPSEDIQKINEIYNRMEHALDHWSEMYDTLVGYLREYLSYLAQEYEDPNPESWRSNREDDDEDDESDIVQKNEEKEYIPNRYLDVFVRVIDTLEAKVGIIETKIEKWTLQAYEYQQCRDALDQILELAVRIKDLRWSVFESYPYEDEIILKINGLTHLINTIFDELK